MSLSDHKDTVQRLYVDEDLTLDELMDFMESNFGILASKDTYKRHFRKWKLRKNNNRDFYIWANHRLEKRSHENPKKKTQILLNGKAIDEKTIQKNIPRQVSTYDQARAAAASPATPQGYSIVTPAGFDILHSSYKDDFERVQLQLRNLPQDIYADTVRTARFIASAKGCVNAAAALFDNEPNVDSRDSKGQTCLGIAVLHNHPAMVSFLIARGANINNRRRDGQTVWTQICTSKEHGAVSQTLINVDAHVNTTVNSVNGLYIPAAGGHIDDVRRLLRRGMNRSSQTPFSWALLVTLTSETVPISIV
ncbi:ankyrin [Aspergillus piperis CBS 112811]|uniref:Ankyrin n=1 Tax=Aspergillus piperis CBS 112811 TaxID=1448313 RepID=A0A8G1VK68_9EURO|nr:ankyrin [Aspergillus piperis CBS 112811]RAH55385.1 ankyrin [Aspergillus piperis CBS 112811]